MVVYKKCNKCRGPKHDYDNYMSCSCNVDGYIETEIPIEQALEALKAVYILNVPFDTGCKITDAIKALEECINV